MMNKLMMVLSILIPAAGGILVALLGKKGRPFRIRLVSAVLILEALAVSVSVILPSAELVLFSMTDTLRAVLYADETGKLFAVIAAYGFLVTGIFAFRYLEKEEGSFPEEMFFTFYLLSLAALVGMDFSANLIGMYFFFEMITLFSMPLVLHERTPEASSAALKYLFYSVAGAFLALGCIFVLSRFSTTLQFQKGGILDPALLAGHETTVLTAVFLGVVGFGAKAGMYPLHGWLPSAHPEAPAPASAVLSGIIAKAGVLAIFRILYFAAGADLLRGTWVQTALLGLSLLTVFMGSMMAYREHVLKKRLAYSSVSQISYALFGLFLLSADGVTGGLMQVMFHACAKICLFLCAGSIIFNTGYHSVDELRGLGKKMPVTFGAFTAASLSLIGIPPFAGFVCKWYLAQASLSSGLPIISWLGPVILLISALLTAGYLLPVTISAFFPGNDFQDKREDVQDGGILICFPLLFLAALTLLLGVAGGSIFQILSSVLHSVF